MKKKIILTTIVGAVLYLSLSSYWYGPGVSGIEGTGARGSSTAGCSCHNPSSSSTSAVTVQLLSGATAVTSYVPGTVYTLKIHGVNNSSSTLPNFGFQMAVVKASGAGTTTAVSAGTFGTAPSGTHTITVSGTSVTVFEHYSSSFGDGSIAATTGSGGTGSTYDITIPWTAPVAGTGSVVIYGVENMVNHDGFAGSPDQWNTATAVTICETPAAITGTMTVCAGATTTLSDVTTGGTWSSSLTSVATVGSTGIVTGVSGGAAVISYTTSCATVTATVTVNAVSPGNFVAAGGPAAAVCAGSSSLVLSNINPGGTWSSVTTSVATVSGGTITGITSGTSVISYTLPSTGCAATTTVTVNASPAISGTLSVCTGLTTTLSATPSGGTWASSNTSQATVGSTGVVTGVAAGNPVITYTSPSGCIKTAVLTVNTTPGTISGTLSLCQGGTTALSDAPGGGTWTSGATSVATILPTGVVSGLVTGSTTPATSVITYTGAGGCQATATVTVNPLPAPIAPSSPTVCQGSTTPLTDATAGGAWSSTSTSVATIGSTGTVAGVSVGSSLISYTLSTGCAATTTISVNLPPAAITGPTRVCVGATITLSDATPGGSWSSADPAVSVSGPAVTGLSAGTATITYTGGTGCFITTPVTIDPLPTIGAIGGTLAVCNGACTTLNCTPAGGSWASSTTSVAAIGSSSGVACGLTNGNTFITYSYTDAHSCTNSNTATLTVNPLPSAITPSSPTVCVGSSGLTLSSGSGGGTWTSGSTSVATIGSGSGTVTGITTGPAPITYTLPTGCTAFTTVTVNPLPTAITGTASVCVGLTTTLNSTPGGGTWSSSDLARATVGSSTGVVTGVLSGGVSPIITYTLPTGCSAAQVVTVNPSPAAITGPSSACAGATATLTDGTTGGAWSSSALGFATVTPAGTSTTVTCIAAGVTTISYTVPSGCSRSITFTVNPVPAVSSITGTTGICLGSTSSLSDVTVGGTWSSSSTAIAPVGTSTGVVTGSSLGSATISYTVSNGFGCSASATIPVTVNPLPAAIAGTSVVCAGSTISLTDATAGGSWTSSAPGTASVGSAGAVTGITAGAAVITYTLPTGCNVTKAVTVNPAPAAISGPSSVCVGLSATLTDATGGGAWSSSNTLQATAGSSSGIVTGVAAGTPTITYTAGGCFATRPITVNPLSPITGASSACSGATVTLSDATPGGAWSSATTSVATIGSTGVVTAVGIGTSVISYTLPSGCIATLTFTVISAPSAISGANHVCVGSSTTLTDVGGGTWSSSVPGIASVGSGTGVVTGVSTGATAVITYSLGTGCNATLPFTVNPLPSAIGGTSFALCPGSAITLTDATGGGTWSSSSGNATVGSSSGLVSGVSAGTAVITYTSSLGCIAVRTVTVNTLPATISGTTNVCVSSTTTLSDVSGGGTWSSSLPGAAAIGSATGIVTGVAAGTASISYTLTLTGCFITIPITVNPLPASITGTFTVCPASTTTLSDASGGGTWSDLPVSTATIGSSSGIVTGVAAGIATITYTLPTGCFKTTPVTVNPQPTAFTVTGGGGYCAGGTGVHIGLSGSQTGVNYQVYSGASTVGSPLTGTGTALDFGLFTTAGTYTIAGTNAATGCSAAMTGSVTVSINPVPSPVGGTAVVCQGLTIPLTDASAGGTWSSSPTTIATVGSSSGIVTGVSAGTATVTYSYPGTGCAATLVVTVNPLPLPIAGTTHVCIGMPDTLTDASSGGTWSSGTPAIATIGSATGILTPLTTGTVAITYALPTGCIITAPFTVNPMPGPASISGPASVCATATISLTDTATGGVWSSSNTSLAAVGSTGVVSGLAAGTDTIFYSVTNICGTLAAMHTVSVNPQPAAGTITGIFSICMGTPSTLADAAPGGAWSSSNVTIATVGSGTGLVSGVAPGSDTIFYRVTNICNTASAFALVTVNALPSAGAITGPDTVCETATISLSDAASGGIWSASNGNATVGSAGIVTGITPGTDTIRYSVTNTCSTATAILLVTIQPHTLCNAGIKPLPPANDGFNVYPNPSGGSFVVEIPATPGNTTITVTDLMGRVIETRTADGTSQKIQFNLGNVAPGSYFVNAHTENKTFRAKVLIW